MPPLRRYAPPSTSAMVPRRFGQIWAPQAKILPIWIAFMPISKAETVILGSVSRQDQNTPAKICPPSTSAVAPGRGAYLRGMKLIGRIRSGPHCITIPHADIILACSWLLFPSPLPPELFICAPGVESAPVLDSKDLWKHHNLKEISQKEATQRPRTGEPCNRTIFPNWWLPDPPPLLPFPQCFAWKLEYLSSRNFRNVDILKISRYNVPDSANTCSPGVPKSTDTQLHFHGYATSRRFMVVFLRCFKNRSYQSIINIYRKFHNWHHMMWPTNEINSLYVDYALILFIFEP